MRSITARQTTIIGLFFAGFLAYGAGVYAFSVFLPYFQAEFGWGRTITGASVSLFWLSAPLLPLFGMWVDRYSAKLLICAGLIIEGLFYVSLIFVHQYWQLFAIRALMGVGKLLVFLPIPTLAVRLFPLRQGLVTGVLMAGTQIGGFALSPLAQYMAEHYGWRAGVILLGLLVTCLGTALVYFLVKISRKPESISEMPVSDGTSEGITVSSAIRTRSFWSIGIAAMLYYYGVSAVLFHQSTFLHDMNVAPKSAALVVGGIAALAAFACFVAGQIVDWLGAKRSIVLMLMMQSASALCLIAFAKGQGAIMLYAFVFLFSFPLGGVDVAWCVLLREHFGQLHYGAIFGSWYLFVVATLISGAVIAGSIYDASGSYVWAFTPVIILPVISATLVVLAKVNAARTLSAAF